MTTDDLRRLLAEAPDPGPWIRPWAALQIRSIAFEDVLVAQRSLDLAVAAVNVLPALLDVVEAARAYRAAVNGGADATTDGEREAFRLALLLDAALARLESAS